MIRSITPIRDTKYAYIEAIPTYITNGLYVDIETTGFSRDKHMIYLLGLIYHNGKELVLEQLLCEKEADEYELLYDFNQRLNDTVTLIHFNGDRFDLPFISHRLSLFGIHDRIPQCHSYDIYKIIQSYRRFLRTDDLKLKTMEVLVGYKRMDPFTGGDLIELYMLFKQGNEKLMPAILLHNEEDMIGLYLLNHLDVFMYLESSTSIQLRILEESNRLILNLPMPTNPYRYQFDHETPLHEIHCSNDGLQLSCSMMTRKLKYFYPNYKEYYYLPVEGYAIHESVAHFVDSAYRKKATKKTAFTFKEDCFIALPFSSKHMEKLMLDLQIPQVPLFKNDYDDSTCYVTIEDMKLIANQLLRPFIKHILKG